MIRVFAPATVANLGAGFDVLGLAVTGLGDTVEAERLPNGLELTVKGGGDLPAEVDKNTTGIAAMAALRRLGMPGGARLWLTKGLPNGSGLGSSAASAAAGAFAVNALYGHRLSPELLVECALEAEASVSGGRFADNVAPAVLGGCQLVRSTGPIDLVPLGSIPQARFVLVTPKVEVLTRQARAALPPSVPMTELVRHTADACGLTAAFLRADYALLARSIHDAIVEPVRARFIPHYDAVRAAALEAGAHAFSISGSGPTVFALTNDPDRAQIIRAAMVAAFAAGGCASRSAVSMIDPVGARQI